MSQRKVLLTGASGRIGRHLIKPLQEKYDLRTLDIQPVPGDPNYWNVPLQDFDGLLKAMQGVDTVIHMAATSNEAPFMESLLPNNCEGMYKTFQAAHEAGVKRMIFASTCQAVLGGSRNGPVRSLDPFQPATMYGATKAFGEVMGHYFHRRLHLEFIAVRIGWFQDYDTSCLKYDPSVRNLWLSPKDAIRFLILCIEKEDVGYLVVSATSKTEVEVLSLQEARAELGYEPVDDVVKIFGPLLKKPD